MPVGDLKGNGEARVNHAIGRCCTISEHEVAEATLVDM